MVILAYKIGRAKMDLLNRYEIIDWMAVILMIIMFILIIGCRTQDSIIETDEIYVIPEGITDNYINDCSDCNCSLNGYVPVEQVNNIIDIANYCITYINLVNEYDNIPYLSYYNE